MAIESDGSLDIEFISKYIRDDSCEKEGNLFKERFETRKSGSVEVFGNVGEGEMYSENTGFKKRYNQDNNFEANDNDEEDDSKSKPKSEAKQEFLKHLEEDSLTLDACDKVNHDWKK